MTSKLFSRSPATALLATALGCVLDIPLNLTFDGAGSQGSTSASPTTGPGSDPTTGPTPTCDDGVMNQDETAVDCGGVCEPCGDPVCAQGESRRCWVECVQDYPPGCLHAGIPPLLMGVQPCASGQWGACVLANDISCEVLAEPCISGDDVVPTSVQCLDGTSLASAYECFLPLGPECATPFFGNWPYSACEEICMSAVEVCDNKGEVRPCEVRCDSPEGPVASGTQDCRDVSCGPLIWGPCLTMDACLNISGHPPPMGSDERSPPGNG